MLYITDIAITYIMIYLAVSQLYPINKPKLRNE